MSSWADYVEWSGLDESKLRHPAGKGIPESPEVRQERMDREACALASSNAAPRPKPESSVVAAARAFGAGMVLFGGLWGLTVCSSIAGELAGGWPL